MRRCAARILAAFVLTLASLASVHAAEPARGWAVPIGGALADDNAEVWSRLVQLAGGPGARFVVFATASEDPVRSAEHAVAQLRRYGAVAEAIPVAPALPGADVAQDVRRQEWIDTVHAARGVFFTGGAQERIVDTLSPGGNTTPLLDAIRDVYHDGGVVAGSSAGAAIMSATMFRDAPDSLAMLRGQWRDGREVGRGLGFVDARVFVDQHFLKRGRIGRMLPLLQAKGLRWGVGVDENAAAVIHGTEVEVLGANGALVVDLGEATSEPRARAFTLRHARLLYLNRGDRIDLATNRLVRSPAKSGDRRIDPNARDFKPYFSSAGYYPDILADSTLVSAMARLLDSPSSDVRGLAYAPGARDKALARLGFEFRLYKGADTAGWFSAASGRDDYTMENIYLDVTPVRVADPQYVPWTASAR